MADYRRVFLDNHSYFITVVTYKRNPILIQNIDLLRESFKYAKTKFAFHIEAIVVLPDHFHLLIHLENAREYPKIIGTLKRYFSRHCDAAFYAHLAQSASREAQRYKPVWQKRFYEHTIWDENDFKNQMDYIHCNPVKHGYCGKAGEWQHSSFHRYIRKGVYDEDWGCDAGTM